MNEAAMTEKTTGTLYVVGTPIGNLDDMSVRGVRTLKEVDLIAAEDTRHSIKLLNHFDIHTRMAAYHKFNEKEESEKLVALLEGGQSVALISDAGLPVISDPGYILVAACHEAGIPVTVIPGPNAALSAVVLSGMDCRHFTFFGFLGKQNKSVKEGMEAIVRSPYPVVVYETPHRLVKTLEKLKEMLPERVISISREITKQYEETRQGTPSELLDWYAGHPPKGEFVLVIDGRGEDTPDDATALLCEGTVEDHLAHYIRQGLTEKEAMKAVARDRGIGKRDVYEAIKIK